MDSPHAGTAVSFLPLTGRKRGGAGSPLEEKFSDRARRKKKTTIRVRWLAILAASYLLIFNRSGPPDLALALLLGSYILSNLILLSFRKEWFERKGFEILVLLTDTGWITLAIVLSEGQRTDLYLAYFLILMFSAVNHNLRTVVLGALIIGVFYGWTVFRGSPDEFFRDPGLLFRIPFLFLVASFYGHFVQENRLLDFRLQKSAEEIRDANRELENMAWSTLRTLLNALDLRDINTGGHSNRVRRLTSVLAKDLGIQGEDLLATEVGALLHDVGKIGIPDSILQKPGPLDPQEWEIMKQHPVLGYRMLKEIGFLPKTTRLVLHHHERYDGNGYPAGLKGNSIPLGARVFAVIDAFDAITSDRPYKKGRSYEAAVEDLRQNSGKQFDPLVVEAFLRIPLTVWTGMGVRSDWEVMEEGGAWQRGISPYAQRRSNAAGDPAGSHGPSH